MTSYDARCIHITCSFNASPNGGYSILGGRFTDEQNAKILASKHTKLTGHTTFVYKIDSMLVAEYSMEIIK